MTTLETLPLIAASKTIAKPLADLYELAKGKVKLSFNKYKNAETINHLYKQIHQIEKVKTLLFTDRYVRLSKFYHPSKIIKDKSHITPNSINDIDSENFVIEGTIGQGKSTLLRFLCIKELNQSKRIPIFTEFRKFKKELSFLDNLLEQIRVYGLEANNEIFEFYAESGKITLLLDGFDEIEENLITSTIENIENLSKKYPSLQIIITSRPNCGIENSPYFTVYKLAPLETKDHKEFIRKIIQDSDKEKDLLNAISNSSTEIKNLLTTPLLLTLLIYLYKHEQSIPDEVSDFYEELFYTLLIKHDKRKAGFIRKRNTTIGDKNILKLFECFCFISKQKEFNSFTTNALHETIDKSCAVTKINCDALDFENEITKIACLIKQEGNKFFFIHKSVQEYFSASFIAHSQDDFSNKFYAAMLENDKRLSWGQELRFLKQIDKYRFYKNYEIPLLKSIKEALPEAISLILNTSEITIEAGNITTRATRITFSNNSSDRKILTCLHHLTTTHLIPELFNLIQNKIEENNEEVKKYTNNKNTTIKPIEIVNYLNITDLITEFKKNLISDINETIQNSLHFIKTEDEKINLLIL